MKILYLGETGSSMAELLKKELPLHQVYAPEIALDPDKAVESITRILSSDRYEMIVGWSLGAFYANLFANAFRILINPTHKPSENENITSEMRSKFKLLERRQFDDVRHAELWGTWGVFSSNDEVVKHDNMFKECYLQLRYIPCAHILTEEETKQYVIPLINEIIDNQEKIRREIELMEMTDLISDFT